MRKLLIPLLLVGLGASVQAAEFVLQLPLGAKSTYSEIETGLPARVPVTRFSDGEIMTLPAPPFVRRSVWEMSGEQTAAAVQNGVLAQLERAGYEILLFCVATDCGGFDFRFGIEVVPAPMMRVDLRDFRFITARQSLSETPAYVTFLISKSPVAVYVQMTEYDPNEPENLVQTEKTAIGFSAGGPAKVSADISVVLEGLVFETGSTALGADPEGAVERLAAQLEDDPDLKVLLVGHSDMTGSLDGNITISKRRAESVRQKLISDFGIASNRVTAHGVGFLAPRAENSTEAGRQKNRRVEAVFSR